MQGWHTALISFEQSWSTLVQLTLYQAQLSVDISSIQTSSSTKVTSAGRHLAPAGALLVAVADLVGGLPDGQVLLDVPAVPAKLLQLHAQRIVLSQGPHRGAAHLQQRIGPYLHIM